MEPGIAAKVAFLSRPESYPETTRKVEVVQTHMSWVFLSDRHAWKLKKPVVTEYLDYGTAALRRRHCLEEVRLNRRFGADVYLGVVPLAIGATGELRLGGRGRAVDWLVRMRRLPATRMLDYVIRNGTVNESDIRNVVAVLWRHYRECPPAEAAGGAYRARLAAEISANQDALGKRDYGLPEDSYLPACLKLSSVLARMSERFDARVREGRIIEGHGDLRPEHVCLLPKPRIIDSLEFAREFRIVDVADELAYLGLECERLGAPTITHVLLDAYACLSGDAPPAALIDFYQALRALLRAKICLWHLDDPGPHDGETWRAKANAYLNLARKHAAVACGQAAAASGDRARTH